MYADDLILLSETKEGLQKSLNALAKFCKDWGLDVNISKTKVMIFNKSGKNLNHNHNFTFNDCDLEVVNRYRYLGIIFQPSG